MDQENRRDKPRFNGRKEELLRLRVAYNQLAIEALQKDEELIRLRLAIKMTLRSGRVLRWVED
jgi:hypothetical protein